MIIFSQSCGILSEEGGGGVLWRHLISRVNQCRERDIPEDEHLNAKFEHDKQKNLTSDSWQNLKPIFKKKYRQIRMKYCAAELERLLNPWKKKEKCSIQPSSCHF